MRRTAEPLCRGGECMGKMEGLDAARAKCPCRYFLEELFWLNATVFYLQVSL
jgi:hypothetical protein